MLHTLLLSGVDKDIEHLNQMGIDIEEIRGVFHKVAAYEDVEIFMSMTEKPDTSLIINHIKQYIAQTPCNHRHHHRFTACIGEGQAYQSDQSVL